MDLRLALWCRGRMKFYDANELSGVKFCDESEFCSVALAGLIARNFKAASKI
nr:hypothetical protein [uncultured Campylobacter sp.]